MPGSTRTSGSAYQLGDTVAGQILPNTFGSNGDGTGDGTALKAAWPADGLADAGVLTSLASDGGINTVVLQQRRAATPTPPLRQRPRPDDERRSGRRCRCCWPTRGSPACSARPRPARRPAGQFAAHPGLPRADRDDLERGAQRAARSLVVAPPTGWDPSPAEAAALLSLTHAGALAALGGRSGHARRAAAKLPSQRAAEPKRVSGAELSDRRYLDQLQAVDASAPCSRTCCTSRPSRPDQLAARGGRGDRVVGLARRGLAGRLAGADRAVQLPHRPGEQGADHPGQEDPARRDLGRDPGVGAERPEPPGPVQVTGGWRSRSGWQPA